VALLVQNLLSSPPPGLQLWMEDLDGDFCTETLYFTRNSAVHTTTDQVMTGSIEFISGEGELVEELIYLAVFREVVTLDGFLSEGEAENRYFGFSANFKVDGCEFNQHHSIINTGMGMSVHIRFLQGHSQLDIEEIEKYILNSIFERDSSKTIIGENLKIQVTEENIAFKIGNQAHLRAA
jgi:hypothetical protein